MTRADFEQLLAKRDYIYFMFDAKMISMQQRDELLHQVAEELGIKPPWVV